MRASVEPWKLVQPGFKTLGYPTLEQACETAGGYLAPRAPDRSEARRIALLYGFVREHLSDLLPLGLLPPVEVAESRTPGWGGFAVCHPRKGGPLSSGGRRVRASISRIALQRSDLARESAGRALATLLHELCHAFGSDGSSSFSAALTDLLERVCRLPGPLADLEASWKRTGAPTAPGRAD
ncbi:MAG: hypothetical protein HY901_22330 [Deltaproteobacteria bacterium]|nr:hypothetical protein [Deltaproteobacteria bacterium]